MHIARRVLVRATGPASVEVRLKPDTTYDHASCARSRERPNALPGRNAHRAKSSRARDWPGIGRGPAEAGHYVRSRELRTITRAAERVTREKCTSREEFSCARLARHRSRSG